MENKETILQELKQISEVVANAPKGNVYTVPSAYFENFPSSILARIHSEIADFGSKTAPFGVPTGYFEGLANNILSKIKQHEQTVEEELNELAPLLNTISKKPVYAVPEGYFESLEITIPLKVANPPAKVLSFGMPKRILQYAVAACTVGILMVGAYFYMGRNSDSTGELASTIPYDSAMKMDVTKELAKMDDQAIDQYLSETPITGYIINNISAEEVDDQQMINTASEEDINEYLNETANPSEGKSGS